MNYSDYSFFGNEIVCLKKLIPTQNMNNLIKPFFKSKCGSCRKIMLITFDENKLRQPNESVSPEEIPKLISILERELNEYNRLGKRNIKNTRTKKKNK